MIQLYIDESGSMTTQHTSNCPYFIIAIVYPQNPRKLRSSYKRFVNSHRDELKAADHNNKMFSNDKFNELKGNELTYSLKKAFVNYFCRDNQFKLFYIVIDNKKIDNDFYKNKARAFNFCTKIALTYFMNKKWLSTNEDIIINIDERNQKTNTKAVLQEYLNTELNCMDISNHDITVQYFDSCDNHLIQIADVFANLLFSELRTQNYTTEIKKMSDEGYLMPLFKFPLEKNKKKCQ